MSALGKLAMNNSKALKGRHSRPIYAMRAAPLGLDFCSTTVTQGCAAQGGYALG